MIFTWSSGKIEGKIVNTTEFKCIFNACDHKWLQLYFPLLKKLKNKNGMKLHKKEVDY